MSAELKRTLENHERWRREQCLNLIAPENVTSPAVRRILRSDLEHRYTAPDRFYMGCKFIDQAEHAARLMVSEMCSSEWANASIWEDSSG